MAVDKASAPPLLSFDAGIERIIQGAEADSGGVKLPDRKALPPSGQQLQLQLDKILQEPSLDRALQAYLQPHIDDPSLLSPTRYQTVLDSAAERLQALADSQDCGASGAFKRAAAVLIEERELRQLLNTYRAILVQG